MTYRKHHNYVDRIYDYGVDSGIKFNSLNYHFFINSSLENNNFSKAYSLFIQSNIENTLLDNSTLFNLYSNLKTQNKRSELKEVIDNIILTNYEEQTYKSMNEFNAGKDIKKKNIFQKVKRVVRKKALEDVEHKDLKESTLIPPRVEINVLTSTSVEKQETDNNISISIEDIKSEDKKVQTPILSDKIIKKGKKSKYKLSDETSINDRDLHEAVRQYFNTKTGKQVIQKSIENYLTEILLPYINAMKNNSSLERKDHRKINLEEEKQETTQQQTLSESTPSSAPISHRSANELLKTKILPDKIVDKIFVTTK